jgi:hypothetical protein
MPKSIKSKTLNLNNNKIFGYFQPTMRQSLVQLAEVIPTSSGRSSYPPSALTRGRLAAQTQKKLRNPRFFFVFLPPWL